MVVPVNRSAPLKIGFVGLDTSHVSVFARMINDPADPNHCSGGRVVAGYPGGSSDFPASRDRVGRFTEELRQLHGAEILDSPESVADRSDLVFITAVDGRVHRELFSRVVGAGKPVFIDKPFTVSSVDAKAILGMARSAHLPVMSCSSLRYAEELIQAKACLAGQIRGCDVFGPLTEEPTQPGLFWYGCHLIEMLVSVMGPGCREVRCVREEGHDSLRAVWADGRLATLRGNRDTHRRWGAVIHGAEKALYADCSVGRPDSKGMIEAIFSSLPLGRSGVPEAEMLEVVRLIEAANQSRESDGRAVALDLD